MIFDVVDAILEVTEPFRRVYLDQIFDYFFAILGDFRRECGHVNAFHNVLGRLVNV